MWYSIICNVCAFNFGCYFPFINGMVTVMRFFGCLEIFFGLFCDYIAFKELSSQLANLTIFA